MRNISILLGLLATSAHAQSTLSPVPSSAPSRANAVQDRAAPAMAAYTRDLLFGDVWKRPQLVPRDRSLITVAALIGSGGNADRMRSHVDLALTNGVKPSELSAMITHLAFYCGWPNAVGAAEVVAESFDKRGIAREQVVPSAPQLPPQIDPKRMAEVHQQLDGFSPAFANYLVTHVYGEVWRDPGLRPRDRSLITIAALIANGDQMQLPGEVQRGLDNGLTKEDLSEIITHLGFYIGWPKAMSAASVIQKAMNAKAPPQTAMRIMRNGAQPPQQGPTQHFTGLVRVGTSFRADAPARFRGATVTFEPGARTKWHSHEMGQMLVILAGHGFVQAEGGAIEEVSAGDVIWTPAGVKHWHGASPTSSMSHLAIAEGENVEWGTAVSDQQYRAKAK